MSQDSIHPLQSKNVRQLSLPEPENDAVQHSEQLIEHIKHSIKTHSGFLPFNEYMEQALYAAGLGYYSAGSCKLGEEGDFVTAPEISRLFSCCLAKSLQVAIDPAVERSNILEVGAGSGIMAADILLQLEKDRHLPQHYFILERSADLRERQKKTLEKKCAHLIKRVEWLDDFPEHFNGVVVANELLDALPVHRVKKQQGQWQELGVQWNERFEWASRKISQSRLLQRLQLIEAEQGELAEGYSTEINLAAEDWINSIASRIDSGYILLIDYGYSQHEYYHPQRQQGTLLCHYRHRAHDDPFVYPGLQDITAHVDFTAIANAGLDAGLKVRGYTTQAFFLMGAGLDELVQTMDSNDIEQQTKSAGEIRRLTLPQEMGESFKVILLCKNTEKTLPGFTMDMRDRL